ncbi:MAG: hypothetical protein ACI4QV_04125 [Acutalibacteraceae bacterium]
MTDPVLTGCQEYSVTKDDDVGDRIEGCNLKIKAWLNGRSETFTFHNCGPEDKICFLVEKLIYSGFDQNQLQDMIEDFID